MNKPFECSRCHKKFATKRAVIQHVSATHHGVGSADKRKPKVYEPDDESFADRAVQAQIDKACGIYNYDQEWLL